MHVAKWGNSLAVRLPAKLVKELGLKEGDEVTITGKKSSLALARQPSVEETLHELRRFRGRLPKSKRLSRDAAHER